MDARQIASSDVPLPNLSPETAGSTTIQTQSDIQMTPRARASDILSHLPRQARRSSGENFEMVPPNPLAWSDFRAGPLPAWASAASAQARQPACIPARIGVPIPQKSLESWLPVNIYDNARFASRSIREYTQEQLQLPEGADVVTHLFNALPDNQKTEPNRALLEKAMTHSVNASGAAMMMVNTDAGLQLVAANSQRRKLVIQSNGACEKGESIRQTVRREFMEELGNPHSDGILLGTLDDANLRSVNGINRIGNTAEAIAARIIKVNANPGNLYLNVTSLFVNQQPVPMVALQAEVALLNERLARAKSFYKAAVQMIYGDTGQKIGPANLADNEQARQAADLAARFEQTCPDSITANFTECFKAKDPHDAGGLKKALEAIIDLSENDEIKLIGESTFANAIRLAQAMDSDESANATLKREYFEMALIGGALHVGAATPEAFTARLKAGELAHAVGASVGGGSAQS